MNKITLAKTITSVIVCAGTSKIVGSIVNNNTNPETITDKVTISAGTFVLGAMVADITKRYTDAKIEEIAAFLTETFKK